MAFSMLQQSKRARLVLTGLLGEAPIEQHGADVGGCHFPKPSQRPPLLARYRFGRGGVGFSKVVGALLQSAHPLRVHPRALLVCTKCRQDLLSPTKKLELRKRRAVSHK